MTNTGHTLDDLGRTLEWGTLINFIGNLGIDSALASELEPDLYQWNTRAKTNAILADIFDMLAVINANLCAKGTKKKPKKIIEYPRYWKKPKTKHIGNSSMSLEDMREWIKEHF